MSESNNCCPMCGQNTGIKRVPSTNEDQVVSLLGEIKTAKSFIKQMEGRIVEKYNWECRLQELLTKLEALQK